MTVPLDDDDDRNLDDSGDCFWCSGEGWDECDDPIECTKEHHVVKNPDGSYAGQLCRCSSCGGSGLAKDMTIW